MIMNPNNITELTSFENEDLEGLVQLLQNVVDDGASIGFLAPLQAEAALNYWKHVLEPGVVLWIVRVEDQIVASVQLHLAQKTNGSHQAEVAKLMVHTDYRRYGLARILMQQLEDRAVQEQRSLLVLDTRVGDPSNMLYQSIGFETAGQIPKFALSSNGLLEDTVIYYKELN